METEAPKKARKGSTTSERRKRKKKRAGAYASTRNKPSEGSRTQTAGLPLAQYAKAEGSSISEVWQEIRQGKLIGRNQKGVIYVYPADNWPEETETFDRFVEDEIERPLQDRLKMQDPPEDRSGDRSGDPSKETDLPPIPGASRELVTQPEPTSEIALLVDHLSLAKEENREILRMTQESIRRMTEMTDRALAMKDDSLAKKEEEISGLKAKLEDNLRQVLKLSQKVEDLEMLNRALSKPHS